MTTTRRVWAGGGAHADAIATILAGERVATEIFAPELAPQLINTWKLAAEHGLYAFDADIDGGPYRLVASPDVPMQVDQLPAHLSEFFRDVRFRFLNFAELKTLTTRTLAESMLDSLA